MALLIIVSTRFSLSMENEQAGAGRETAEPVSRDQILRRARGRGNIHFPFSADHETLDGLETRVLTAFYLQLEY